MVTDNGRRTAPEGPARGPTPLGSHGGQKRESRGDQKLQKLEKENQSHLFNLQLYWPDASPTRTDWPNTYEAVGYSHLRNPRSSPAVLCWKPPSGPRICTRTPSMCLLWRGMTIFWFLIVLNASCQEKFSVPRKKGRWVREGKNAKKKGFFKKGREELSSGQGFSRQGKSPWRRVTRVKTVVHSHLLLDTLPPTGTPTVPEGKGYHLGFQ